ncbi:MAG TPA: NYN domain-containing protein [Candidatus Krumholzibacteria bacterium]|nr:NYN domain-containing protein [Candidatus Krumholzibacteria bacterium]
MANLHIFLDNSNVWIEGQRAATGGPAGDERRDAAYRIDFGKLLEHVRAGRTIVEAMLYGSEPPPNDTVWSVAKERGFEAKVFKRNFQNREKKVDTQLCVDVTRTLYSNFPKDRVLILIAGDADYLPAIEVALEREWNVEVYFWTNASRELRQDSRFAFCDLSPHAFAVGFRA